MPWETIIRSINAVGCLLSLWFLATAAFRQWQGWSDKTQAHWWALLGWVFLGFESSLETIVLDIEPGPRTVIQTLVVAWTVRALSLKGKLEAHSEIPWKDTKKK